MAHRARLRSRCSQAAPSRTERTPCPRGWGHARPGTGSSLSPPPLRAARARQLPKEPASEQQKQERQQQQRVPGWRQRATPRRRAWRQQGSPAPPARPRRGPHRPPPRGQRSSGRSRQAPARSASGWRRASGRRSRRRREQLQPERRGGAHARQRRRRRAAERGAAPQTLRRSAAFDAVNGLRSRRGVLAVGGIAGGPRYHYGIGAGRAARLMPSSRAAPTRP